MTLFVGAGTTLYPGLEAFGRCRAAEIGRRCARIPRSHCSGHPTGRSGSRLPGPAVLGNDVDPAACRRRACHRAGRRPVRRGRDEIRLDRRVSRRHAGAHERKDVRTAGSCQRTVRTMISFSWPAPNSLRRRSPPRAGPSARHAGGVVDAARTARQTAEVLRSIPVRAPRTRSQTRPRAEAAVRASRRGRMGASR